MRLLFAPGRRGLTRRDRAANSLLHLVTGLDAPRSMPPLPASGRRRRRPALVTPKVKVTADLREQLPALEAAMGSQLEGEGDPMERFAAYAEQQRRP